MHLSKKILSYAAIVSLGGCIYVTPPPGSGSPPVVNDYVAPGPAQPPPSEPPAVSPVVEYQPPPPEVAPVYETELSPYGRWFVDPRYGRCWRPSSRPYGWQPYTVGHWVYTDDGSCYWVAEDRESEWGDVVYHYGQWVLTAQSGWIWVPGTVWAPAWVAWREGNGYCGWTPLPPEACQGDVTVVVVDRYCPPDRYVYCDERRFQESRSDRYIVRNNVTIINNTTNITNVTIVNNRIVNRGVPSDRIERVSGRSVNRLQVTEASNPEEARRVASSGTPVHFSTPAIEQTHTRVVQEQAQIQAERAQKADADRKLKQLKLQDRQNQIQLQQQTAQDKKIERQTTVEETRRAAEDQKLARDEQAEAARQAEREKQLEHQKQMQDAQAAQRATAEARAKEAEAKREAQAQQQQQAAAEKQAAHERSIQAARDAEAQRQAERDKAAPDRAADAPAADRPAQGKPAKGKAKPGQPGGPPPPQ